MTTKAAVYVRISKDSGGESLGVTRQREDCTRKAADLGWTVHEVYEDNDVSASKNRPRPAYERMLADLRAGVVAAVVVYDLDRLTRRPIELEGFIDLVEAHGVLLANVAGDVDLTTGNGKMLARFKGAIARQEADRLGERVKRQKQQRKEMGKPHGGKWRTFGYERDYTLHPAEAPALRDAYKRVLTGTSMATLADELNAAGLIGTGGTPWTATKLGATMRNPLYCGRSVLNGQVVGKTQHDAITDEATFDAFIASRKAQPKGHSQRKYLLSGLALCAECLSPMVGKPSNYNQPRYVCRSDKGGCGSLSIKARWLDDATLYFAHRLYASRLVSGQVDTDDAEIEEATARAQAAVDDADRRITELQAAYNSGALTLADLSPMLRQAREDKDSASEELSELTMRAEPQDADLLTRAVTDFDGMELSERTAYISRHLSAVVVKRAAKISKTLDTSRFVFETTDGKRYGIDDALPGDELISTATDAVVARMVTGESVETFTPARLMPKREVFVPADVAEAMAFLRDRL